MTLGLVASFPNSRLRTHSPQLRFTFARHGDQKLPRNQFVIQAGDLRRTATADLLSSTAHLDPNRQDFVDFPLQH